ncbi:MAG: hypothetical protein K0S98_316, partial [Propionibacteriaceae bacterium]|nr:hypothetical protein [Propionibacteriaceae bacterium]
MRTIARTWTPGAGAAGGRVALPSARPHRYGAGVAGAWTLCSSSSVITPKCRNCRCRSEMGQTS